MAMRPNQRLTFILAVWCSFSALGECVQPQSATGTQSHHDQSDIRTLSDDPHPQTGQGATELEASKSKEGSPDTTAAVTGKVPHKTSVDDSQNSQHKLVQDPSSSSPVNKAPQAQSSSEGHEERIHESDFGGQTDSVASSDGTKQVADVEQLAHDKTSRQLPDEGMQPHANSIANTLFGRPEVTPDTPAQSSEEDSVHTTSTADTLQQDDKTVQETTPLVNSAADLHPEDKREGASEPDSDSGSQSDRTESEEDRSKKRGEESKENEAFEAGEGDEEFDKGEEDDECEENDRGKKKEEEEEEEPAEDLYSEGAALIERLNPDSKRRGYLVLQQAADKGNRKAKEQLAYGYLLGNSLDRNFTRAFEIFSELAAQGNPAGQQGLGFLYSTGVGITSNQAKAILYYTFAALGGHHYAQMAMGYRAHLGISMMQSCEAALSYYSKAASKVVSEATWITGGHSITKVRLMDLENEGTDTHGISEDDMVHYHSVFADSGNTGAQLVLGIFYLHGMGGVERNFQIALKFLQQAAEDGAAAACALIGKIYTEGSEEVPQNYATAIRYFKEGIALKHQDSYSGLGLMYLEGMGLEQNYRKALDLFQIAADKGSPEGQYYLGHMLMNGLGTRRDVNKALRYFQLASHGGHLRAVYNLGKMHADGIGVKRNCNYAVELLKSVAERGKWTRLFMEAQKLYAAGDMESALMMYLLLSELGFEVAQSNAAYILDQEEVDLVTANETLKRALVLWNRAAAQGYSHARVKLGDYYYYGQGTEVNYEAAAGQYRIASDKQSSAQAMFNLGYMYEHGVGLKKDYHLAKRYYDLAAQTSSEALVPVNLALLKLNFFYYYDNYNEYFDVLDPSSFTGKLDATLGPHWDIYLMSLLIGLVILLLIWRRGH